MSGFPFGGVCFRDRLGSGGVHFHSTSSGLAPCNELILRQKRVQTVKNLDGINVNMLCGCSLQSGLQASVLPSWLVRKRRCNDSCLRDEGRTHTQFLSASLYLSPTKE